MRGISDRIADGARDGGESEVISSDADDQGEKKVDRNPRRLRGPDRRRLLDQGKKIACITLGDPTVYIYLLYVQKRLKRAGYTTELIPGIPSFCAAAARLGSGLWRIRKNCM